MKDLVERGKGFATLIGLLVVIGRTAVLFVLTTFVVFAALYMTPGGRGPDRVLAVGDRGSNAKVEGALTARGYDLTWVPGTEAAHTWLQAEADLVERRGAGIQTRVQLVLVFAEPAKGDGVDGAASLPGHRTSLRNLPVVDVTAWNDGAGLSLKAPNIEAVLEAVERKSLSKRRLIAGYWSWLTNFPGYNESGSPIGAKLWGGAVRTILLVGGSLTVALVIALGMIALEQLFPDSWWMKVGFYVVNLVSGIHILILSLLFVVITGVYGKFSVAMLFILALGNGTLSDLVTVLRQEAERILSQDYIFAAVGRGGSRLHHAGREASISLIESTISRLPALVGGTIVLEWVCSYVGLGYYIVDAIGSRPRDVTMTMGVTTVIVAFMIVGNLVGDLMRVFLDPRVTS
jgi:peptide/nickel transport system permease protein